jgi:hypothetical protein
MPEPQVLGKNGGLTAAKLKKEFALDGHNVCGNTWRMLQQTRFKDHFTFVGGT